MSKWIDDEIKLRKYGVSEEKISLEKQRRIDAYRDNGISDEKINEILGIKKPDESTLSSVFSKNLESYNPEEADTFLEAIDAGWQVGASSIIPKVVGGKNALPDVIVPDHAPTYMKVASGLSTVVSDAPAMIAGYIAGKTAGAPISAFVSGGSPVGTAIGSEISAQFAANALPEAIRTAAMEYYSRGEIKNSSEFFDLASEVFIKTLKSGAVGVATFGAGKAVSKGLSGKVGENVVKSSSLATEIITMTTLGKALEGELPSAEDFTTSAAIIASIGTIASGFRYSSNVAAKLRNIYAKNGMKPKEVISYVEKNPDLVSDFLTEGDDIPSFFDAPAESPLLPEKTGTDLAPPKTTESKSVEIIKKDVEAYRSEFERGDVGSDIHGAMKRFKESVGQKKMSTEEIDAQVNKFLKEAPSKAYTKIWEKEYPVKQLMKMIDEDMPLDDKNSYVLQRVYNGYQGKVLHFLNHGTLNAKDLSVNGPSMKSIMEDAGGDRVGLSAYLTALRVYSLKKLRGIDQPMQTSDAEVIIKDLDSKMRPVAQKMYDRRRKVLEYGRDLGLYSEQFIKDLEKNNPFYIPLRKQMESETSGIGKSNLFKKIKSTTDAQLIDPIEGSIMSESAIIRMAEQNRFRASVIDRLSEMGLATKKTDRAVVKENLDKEFIEWKGRELIEITKESDLSIFEDIASTLADNEVYRRIDGKVEIWELSKDAPAYLKESIESIGDNPVSSHWSMRILSAYVSIKKLGITLPLEFLLSNVFKDYQGTMIKSLGSDSATWRQHATEYYSAIMSLTFKNTEQFRSFIKSGSAFSDWANSSEFLAELSLNDFEAPKYNDARQSVINGMSKAKEIFGTMQFVSENLGRIIENTRVREGESSGPKLWSAGLAGRDVALDYSRRGLSETLANYSAMKAYLNIAIQSPDNVVRFLTDKKVPFATKSLRIAQYVTVPAILSWLVMKDREEYKEAPTWEKMVYNFYPVDYWVKVESEDDAKTFQSNLGTTIGRQNNKEEDGNFYINKGFTIRLPKIEGLGTLFGTIPVMMLDRYFQENPKEFDAFKNDFFSQVVGLAVPDALQTPFEQFSNKSFFTNNRLVPSHLEDASPYQQYTPYTSDTARAIGNIVGKVPLIGQLGPRNAKISSPIVVDQYIRNMTGGAGQYALQLLDKAVPKGTYARSKAERDLEKGYSTLSDVPVIKRFVRRFPSASMASIEEFGNVYDEYKKFKADEGAEKRRMNFESAIDARIARMTEVGEIGATKSAIDKLHWTIAVTSASSKFTEDDKKRIIEGAYFNMVQMSRRGLEFHRQIKKKREQLKQEGIEP